MGWSKRGSGFQYDSFRAVGHLIGLLTGEVLSYAIRSRKCKKCDLNIPHRDCRLNFWGSSKAIKADVAILLKKV